MKTDPSSDRIEEQIEIKAPVSRVWKALTDYKEFGAWFHVNLEGPFIVGHVARGLITHPGYEHVVWQATIVSIAPEHRFAFTWHPYGVDKTRDYSAEVPTLVEFLLSPTAHGTLLKLVESGFDKIPADRRAEAFRMNEHGWSTQMTNIAGYVES